jgi:hypothetical protein
VAESVAIGVCYFARLRDEVLLGKQAGLGRHFSPLFALFLGAGEGSQRLLEQSVLVVFALIHASTFI